MLDDLRCSGGAHAGCQASCRLFWKEAWLRPASEPVTPAIPDSAYSELEELARPQRRVEGLHRRRADLPMSGDGLVWREPSGGMVERSVVPQRMVVRQCGLLAVLGDDGTDRARGDRPQASSDPSGRGHAAPISRPNASRRLRRAGSSRARWFRSAPGRRSSRHSTRRAGTRACGSIVARCSPSVARPFRSRAVWSGSSMRTPGSSSSSRATATCSTAWSAPGTAARASGFAGEPSIRGGERRGLSLSQRHRRRTALKRRIQLLEQRTESRGVVGVRTWTSVRPRTRRYAPDDFAGCDIACHDRAGADERMRADANPSEHHRTRTDRRPALDDRLEELPVRLASEVGRPPWLRAGTCR